MSVIGFAAPPSADIVHSVPRRSIAIVRPSGDSAAAIDVPSCSVTCTGRGAGACAPAVTTIATRAEAARTGVRMGVVYRPTNEPKNASQRSAGFRVQAATSGGATCVALSASASSFNRLARVAMSTASGVATPVRSINGSSVRVTSVT